MKKVQLLSSFSSLTKIRDSDWSKLSVFTEEPFHKKYTLINQRNMQLNNFCLLCTTLAIHRSNVHLNQELDAMTFGLCNFYHLKKYLFLHIIFN